MSSGPRRRFKILKEIAEGGFGKVYLAEQLSLDGFSRIVAVKLLHAKWSSHDEVVMRTRDEARLLGLIRHQHIVKVEDLTSIDGKCAIVMEYLEGVDLKWMSSFLQERGLPFPRAALFEIVLAVASALDAAYNGVPLQGGDPLKVIHRDIKPSNIFVTVPGAVKVLDFGTARANFAEREAKTQALAFGSQGYMAPERMLGEEDTPAADIFSLGISLYELLSQTAYGRIPPRPNKFASKVKEKVDAIQLGGSTEWADQVRETLRLMLAYEPKDRPTAAQLVEIMELLAQQAEDMSLRRFCRTLVSDAKDALPVLDSGDPLTGTVVEEDTSMSFGGAAARESSNSMPIPRPVDAPSPTGPPMPRPVPSLPPSLGDYEIGGGPPAAAEEAGGPGLGLGLLAAGLFAFVIALVLGAIAVGGIAALVLTSDTTSQAPPAPPPEAPVPPPDPVPAPGGRIVQPDSRADAPRVPTVLQLQGGGGTVTIKGGGGFAAEWDGVAPFDLGGLVPGRYATVIELSTGAKIRGKSFTVAADAPRCAFTFDVDASDWTGGCE